MRGVGSHELGSADYMGGDFVGVFVNTLDDVEPLELVMHRSASQMA